MPKKTNLTFVKGEFIEETLTLFVNGQAFEGWEEMSITQTLDALATSFAITTLDRWRQESAEWPIKPGDVIHIHSGKQSFFQGYADAIDVSFEAGGRKFAISGRSKTSDLVDCSHDGELQFQNVTIDQLAATLAAPFGIKVLLRAPAGDPFDPFNVKPGETIHAALERAARLRGLLLQTSLFGNLIITRRGETRSPTELIQGVNIEAGSASFNNTDRFSKYTVKGQTKGTDENFGENAAGPKGTATDLGVTRTRPKTIIAEGSVDNGKALERAKWEATVRAAKAVSVSITTPGWRRSDGTLWEINQLVKVDARFLGLARQDFLISGIGFKKSISSGTMTDLTLTRPDAYEPKSVIPKKKDSSLGLGWEGFKK